MFELVEQVSISDSYSTSDSQYGLRSHKIRLNTYEGSGKYIAIKDIRTSNGFVLVDNVSVTQLPACLEPTNVDVDGGMNAVVTWEGDADDYDIAFSDDNTVDPDEAIVGSTTEGALSFNLGEAVTLTEGDYFVWVRAKCGETDGNSPWVGPFDLHVGYCIPAPTNVDGDGITNVTFGKDDDVVNIDTPTAAYTDYTSEIGGLQAGVASTIAITTGTGSYPYAFVIWVDLDNSLTFDDDEMLYVGQATSGDGTLNATITIPADQALGDYRMRIYGADMALTVISATRPPLLPTHVLIIIMLPATTTPCVCSKHQIACLQAIWMPTTSLQNQPT